MKRIRIFILTLLACGWLAVDAGAQTEAAGSSFFSFSSDFIIEYTFTAIAIVLLIIIIMLSRFYSKLLSDKGQRLISKVGKNGGSALVLLGLFLIPQDVWAAGAGIKAHMTEVTFFVIALVLIIELFVIVFLVRNITSILGLDEETEAEEALTDKIPSVSIAWGALWTKMNAFKSKEKEKEILKDHEYDGIRELDNDLPPWWVWGFYLTIAFSVVYLWRYHVSQTAPLQIEELEISIAKAEEEMRAYRTSAANLVDETTMTIVDDYDFIEKGRLVYISNCVACHGMGGEGGVGPNLTDDYWIHGPDIKSIFKVVKYGVVEKGMTPWKDLLSATQIAQVSNYVKTLYGTEPANPKEPQGDLFVPSEEEKVEDLIEDESEQVEM